MNKNINTSDTNPRLVVRVAVAANQRYYPGLVVAVCSALMHLSKDCSVNVLIIDGGIDADSREMLIELVSELREDACVTFAEPDLSVFDGLPLDYGKSTMAYARLLLPGMLHDQERVIYIDSDVIIMRDLTEIWNCAQDKPVAAAPDFLYKTIAWDCPDPEAMGVAPDTPYFNSGVMVMNLALWREHQIVERCLLYLRKRPDWCRWWDQSALNVVLAGNWETLNDQWNTCSRLIDEFSSAKNYHYYSTRKPWLTHEESLQAQPFYEYAERLGLRLDMSPEYRKSTIWCYLSPLLILGHLIRVTFWVLLLKRWNASVALKKLRYWCAYLHFWLVGNEKRKIGVQVGKDFASHFPNRK